MSWKTFNQHIAEAMSQIEKDREAGVSRCPVCDKTYQTLKKMRECSDSHVSYGASLMGKKGGKKSKRKLTSEQAREMVKIRESKK